MRAGKGAGKVRGIVFREWREESKEHIQLDEKLGAVVYS